MYYLTVLCIISLLIVILPNLSAGARVYIDQRTYKDVEEAVKEFANELERSWIELERLIGGGMLRLLYQLCTPVRCINLW